MPPQPPINPRADNYAETSLRLTRLAQMTTRTALDLSYGDDYWQKLDIYLPPSGDAKGLPVFVNIHGGGWTHGYKEWMGHMAPAIVALPAVYVSLSYRLSPPKHPAQLDDCLAGLAWVYKNIHLFGGDPNRIHVGGHSAGAHLSALMTLRRDLHARHGLPPSVIKSCFPYSGVYWMLHPNAEGKAETFPAIMPLIGKESDIHDASPGEFIAGNTTPFYVTWAENDNPFCLAQSARFAEALKKEKGRVESHCFPMFDHFSITVDMQRPENLWTRTLLAWMKGDPTTAKP